MSSFVGTRRYARRASVVRIFVAQAVSSRLLAGWQTNSRRRLGDSCDTRPLYGPPISSDEIMSGLSGLFRCSRLQIGIAFGPSPSSARLSGLTIVASRERARGLDIIAIPDRPSSGRKLRRAADGKVRHSNAVEANVDVVRPLKTADD